jgi:hypothetical protein
MKMIINELETELLIGLVCPKVECSCAFKHRSIMLFNLMKKHSVDQDSQTKKNLIDWLNNKMEQEELDELNEFENSDEFEEILDKIEQIPSISSKHPYKTNTTPFILNPIK